MEHHSVREQRTHMLLNKLNKFPFVILVFRLARNGLFVSNRKIAGFAYYSITVVVN